MHSVARTVKAGSPLGRAISNGGRIVLLQPTKATAHNQCGHAAAVASISTSSCRSGPTHVSSLSLTNRAHWTRRFYSTTESTTGSSSTTTTSATTRSLTIQELEQLLVAKDYAAFQQACLATTNAGDVTKEMYHFLLQTLGQRPVAFAPSSYISVSEGSAPEVTAAASLTEVNRATTISTLPNNTSNTERFDPLQIAMGILTDMSREANVMGRAALQPDRETLLLLLNVAGSKKFVPYHHGYHKRWDSVRVLVDAIRHGRLPAVMSTDQWELPRSRISLDGELWKGMFACVQRTAEATGRPQLEVDTMTFLMADQLWRTSSIAGQDAALDEQLLGHIVQAFGNAGSASKLDSVISKLPAIDQAGSGLYSLVAEALANCGSITQATEIMNTLVEKRDTLPDIAPFVALSRHYATTGNYAAIRNDQKIWNAQGVLNSVNASRAKDHRRSLLEATAVALDRMVDSIMTTMKDRQMDMLPKDVLPGMASPPQMNSSQYSEVKYLWRLAQDAMQAEAVTRWTPEDYDIMIRISTRLNLLQPAEWKLLQHPVKMLAEMRRRKKVPLKSTYLTMMETVARTREFGPTRDSADTVKRVWRLFDQMREDGHAVTSPEDFRPLIEACFGIYSHSPFSAGQWMYSNQLYPVSREALRKIEKLMQDTLAPTESSMESSSTIPSGGILAQYHNSTTIASVLAGLAHGDELEDVWVRWDELALQGIERDAKLYQTVIAASRGQDKHARYVLNRVRHDMARESPPVVMTPEIFAGLLNCCVRVRDANTARSLIQQCSASGEIQRTAEWYVPMVRTCLSIDGMEDEGAFLLEEMRKNDMKMDSFSGGFYEFIMDHFVMKRMDYQAGREVFKNYVNSEQILVERLLEEKKSKGASAPGSDKVAGEGVWMSDREVAWHASRLQAPVEQIAERLVIAPRTATMLNLLALSHIRERSGALEQEKRSGFSAGSKERMRDAKAVMHYLTGESKSQATAKTAAKTKTITSSKPSTTSTTTSSPSPPEPSSSTSTITSSAPSISPPEEKSSGGGEMRKGPLVFVNKFVLGEYIDMCIKEGTAESLSEADWGVQKVLPRVIGESNMATDARRLRSALWSAWNKLHQSEQQQLQQQQQGGAMEA